MAWVWLGSLNWCFLSPTHFQPLEVLQRTSGHRSHRKRLPQSPKPELSLPRRKGRLRNPARKHAQFQLDFNPTDPKCLLCARAGPEHSNEKTHVRFTIWRDRPMNAQACCHSIFNSPVGHATAVTLLWAGSCFGQRRSRLLSAQWSAGPRSRVVSHSPFSLLLWSRLLPPMLIASSSSTVILKTDFFFLQLNLVFPVSLGRNSGWLKATASYTEVETIFCFCAFLPCLIDLCVCMLCFCFRTHTAHEWKILTQNLTGLFETVGVLFALFHKGSLLPHLADSPSGHNRGLSVPLASFGG